MCGDNAVCEKLEDSNSSDYNYTCKYNYKTNYNYKPDYNCNRNCTYDCCCEWWSL